MRRAFGIIYMALAGSLAVVVAVVGFASGERAPAWGRIETPWSLAMVLALVAMLYLGSRVFALADPELEVEDDDRLARTRLCAGAVVAAFAVSVLLAALADEAVAQYARGDGSGTLLAITILVVKIVLAVPPLVTAWKLERTMRQRRAAAREAARRRTPIPR